MLPDTSYSEAEIMDRARQKNIRLFPFSDFYVSGQSGATTLLLGFGGMNDSEIERGIALLSQICRSA
jgi:GntR family transcriptional regulator/MocR family aminotransferase